MTMFRDFTFPLWEIFAGNVLLLVTCVFYILWWGLSFGSGGNNGASILIAVALLAGILAIVSMALGISSLPSAKSSLSTVIIIASASVGYFVLQFVTQALFQRETTSELLIIVIWCVLQFVVLNSLGNSGRFSTAVIVAISILVVVATCIGLVCYTIFYKVDENAQYLIGFVPIAVDAGVGIVLLSVMSLS